MKPVTDVLIHIILNFSDIIFATKTDRRAISLGVSRISLRSDITRRKANITEARFLTERASYYASFTILPVICSGRSSRQRVFCANFSISDSIYSVSDVNLRLKLRNISFDFSKSSTI